MVEKPEASVLDNGKGAQKKSRPKKSSRKRRKRKPKIKTDGIYGKMIGMPPGPLAWWGPFDVGYAVGRVMILLGLLCLCAIIGYAAEYLETGSLSQSGIIEVGPFLRLATKNAIFILTMFEFFLIPVGLGFLWRRQWAVAYLRLIFAPSSLLILFLSLLSFRDAIFWGEPRTILLDQFGSLSFFGLIGRGVMYFLIFAGFAFPLIMYWSVPHAKYNFSYVRHDKVESLLLGTTGWFGICIALLGGALLLMGLILGLLGVPIYFRGETYTMWPQHGLILGAAAAFILLTIFLGFRVWIFLPGAIIILGGLLWSVFLWTRHILPSVADSPTDSHNAQIDFNLLKVGVFIAFPGFMFLIAGLGFRKKSNKARIILQVLSLLMIPLCFAGSVPDAVETVRGFIENPGAVHASKIVWLIIHIFGLLIPTYIFFELWRFLRTGKAKEYCGAGEYERPWKYQVEEILAARAEKSLEKNTPVTQTEAKE